MPNSYPDTLMKSIFVLLESERNVKVLYCTRHTFVNALYQNKVDENVIKVLVGHEKEFTMKHYGGEPFSPDQLLQEISKVNYKGIKWDRLKI